MVTVVQLRRYQLLLLTALRRLRLLLLLLLLGHAVVPVHAMVSQATVAALPIPTAISAARAHQRHHAATVAGRTPLLPDGGRRRLARQPGRNTPPLARRAVRFDATVAPDPIDRAVRGRRALIASTGWSGTIAAAAPAPTTTTTAGVIVRAEALAGATVVVAAVAHRVHRQDRACVATVQIRAARRVGWTLEVVL